MALIGQRKLRRDWLFLIAALLGIRSPCTRRRLQEAKADLDAAFAHLTS